RISMTRLYPTLPARPIADAPLPSSPRRPSGHRVHGPVWRVRRALVISLIAITGESLRAATDVYLFVECRAGARRDPADLRRPDDLRAGGAPRRAGAASRSRAGARRGVRAVSGGGLVRAVHPGQELRAAPARPSS